MLDIFEDIECAITIHPAGITEAKNYEPDSPELRLKRSMVISTSLFKIIIGLKYDSPTHNR